MMGVVTPTITSDGQTMDQTFELLDLVVTKAVNRVPTAEIRLLDGSAASQEFAVSDTSFFEPGRQVEIKLRYEGDRDHDIFTGVVVEHSVEADRTGSYLTVRLKDKAVTLTQTRKSAVYAEKTDTDAIKGVIADAGLQSGTIPTTKPTHEELVQYNCTDWDFIVSRADVNGLMVLAEAGQVAAAPLDVSGAAKHTFEFGLSHIYDFEMTLNGTRQPENVESIGWDPAAQELTQPTPGKEFSTSQGDLKGQAVAEKVGFGTYRLLHPVPVEAEELQAWADARVARSRMAMLRGRIGVPGMGDLALLDVIEIAGIGARFNGTTVVSGLAHRVSSEGWRTDVQFGVSPDWFSSEPEIHEPPAAGLLPAVGGLHIGVVAAIEEDPQGEFRARVTVPGINAGEGLLWARLMAPDAGAERGWFFRPEVGDEVVLGFFNEDPRRPVVLGSLYSSANPPPAELPVNEDNFLKGIVTRSGSKLIFDDEKPTITIATPAENQIVIDDEAATITVTDQHGSTITMSEEGIDLTSAAALTIQAAHALKVDAEGGIEISTAGDLKLTADGGIEIDGAQVDVK